MSVRVRACDDHVSSKSGECVKNIRDCFVMTVVPNLGARRAMSADMCPRGIP